MSSSVRGPLSPVVSSENSVSLLHSPEKISLRGRMSGEASPSAVCRHRRHSPVLVTPGADTHGLAEGRPSITVPRSAHLTSRSTSSGERRSHASLLPAVPKGILERASTVPIEQSQPKYLSVPPSLRLDAWTEPPGSSFNVRGGSYLEDKTKVPSMPAYFTLLTADLVKSHVPILGGLCAHPKERIQLALARERETGVKELPEFIFAVNLLVPGYHMVQYFGCNSLSDIKNPKTSFERIANQFFFGASDEFRNQAFKLIPRIVEGNFMVKKAVGTKPAILGKKLRQIYIKTDRFFEIIVDIDSDTVARKITKLSLGYAKTLHVDMAFVLEGKEWEHLPEQIAGVIRLQGIDFKDKDGKRLVIPEENDVTN